MTRARELPAWWFLLMGKEVPPDAPDDPPPAGFDRVMRLKAEHADRIAAADAEFERMIEARRLQLAARRAELATQPEPPPPAPRARREHRRCGYLYRSPPCNVQCGTRPWAE